MSSSRNIPQDFDIKVLEHIQTNTAEVQQKAKLYSGNPRFSRSEKAERLRLAVRCMDLTTLSGGDDAQQVRLLCATAQRPLMDEPELEVAAVCLYPLFITTAKQALVESSVPIASVAAGFPTGLLPMQWRLNEVKRAVALGAQEIDVVAPRHFSLSQNWQGLYDDVRALRETCGPALLKVILETGQLPDLDTVARASYVAMLAGADFIKTSTGKEAVGATLEAGIVMARMIRAYHEQTGLRVGLKPAGGLRRAQHAWQWLLLVEKELGEAWLQPRYFRIGASSLLATIQQQLRALQNTP
jgi:deoxyribose-phosphate aldolase